MESKTAFNPEDLLASYEKQGYIINRGILAIDGEPVYTLSNGPTVRMLYWPKRQSFEILTPDHKAYQVESLWPVDKKAPVIKKDSNPWMDFKTVKRMNQRLENEFNHSGTNWAMQDEAINKAKIELKEKQSVWGWKEGVGPTLNGIPFTPEEKWNEKRVEAQRCLDAQGWKAEGMSLSTEHFCLVKGNFVMSYFLKTREFVIILRDTSVVKSSVIGYEFYRLIGVLNPLYAMKEIEAVLSLVPHEYHSNKTGEWVYYQSNGFDRYFIEKQ